MGCYIDYIAFRQEPDTQALASVPGLRAYRLFRRADRPEWVLEGLSAEGETVSFSARLDYAPEGPALKQAQQAVAAFRDACRAAGVTPYHVHEGWVRGAVALSAVLGLPLFAALGDDDGADAAFVCTEGAILYGKAPDREGNRIVYEPGSARLEALDSDETWEDGSPVRDMHQYCTEVANQFFGETIRWRVTSDPSAFDPGDYTLVATSAPPRRKWFWLRD